MGGLFRVWRLQDAGGRDGAMARGAVPASSARNEILGGLRRWPRCGLSLRQITRESTDRGGSKHMADRDRDETLIKVTWMLPRWMVERVQQLAELDDRPSASSMARKLLRQALARRARTSPREP